MSAYYPTNLWKQYSSSDTHMASLGDFFIHWHLGECELRSTGRTWSPLPNSLLQQNSWLNFTNANRLLTSILVRSGQSWWCWWGHVAHGSYPWRIWSRSAGVQDKLCFKACQRDETRHHFREKSPVSDSLFVPISSIYCSRVELAWKMRRMKTSREDR